MTATADAFVLPEGDEAVLSGANLDVPGPMSLVYPRQRSASTVDRLSRFPQGGYDHRGLAGRVALDVWSQPRTRRFTVCCGHGFGVAVG